MVDSKEGCNKWHQPYVKPKYSDTNKKGDCKL